MNQIDRSAAAWAPIELAREPDFEVGPLRVRPARCEVEAEGVQQVLQRRTMQVLVALARSSSAVVSHDELNARCWRGVTVGEDAIARCIGQLRRLARQWSPPPFEIVTTVGVGYRLQADGAGSSQAAEATIAPTARRQVGRGVWIGAVAAVAVLGVGVGDWTWRSSAARSSANLAVTAFEPVGAGASARTLGKAIDAELLNELNASQIPARPEAGAQSVAAGDADLQAGGVVEDDGHLVRATVRLVDAPTRAVIWTAVLERPSGETSTLPTEVAAQATDVIAVARFAKTASPPVTDDPALTTLLAAHSAIGWDRSHDWARRIQLARELTRMAPRFAYGRSLLAYVDINAVRLNVMPEQSALLTDEARRQAKQAVELDPSDAGGYFALALLEPKIEAREAIVSRGLAHNGHPAAQVGALNGQEGHILLEVGRIRAALPYVERALALDPLSPLRTANAIVTYALAGRVDEAHRLLADALARWPDQPDILSAQLYLASFFDQPEAALREFADASRPPGSLGAQGAAAWRSYMAARVTRDPDQVARATASVVELAHRGVVNPRFAILMLAQLGDLDAAFDGLANLRNDTSDVTGFEFGPAAAPLRADPRFVAFASHGGLLDYWRQTGRRPDICTGTRPEAECAAFASTRP